jgi:5,10-methylenetetrahydromethanopterin reductase
MVVLEAEFSPGMELDECVRIGRLVEDAGFDRLGVSDVLFWQDSYVVQALCARATSSIELGSMVTNPYLRHPAVTAAAVATIDDASSGRAFLGLGVGAGLEAVGIEYPRPVVQLREAIAALRALLAGESLTWKGEIFRFEDARLRVVSGRSIPIAIGTRSEQVAKLAGEIGDRALVGARYLSPLFAERYRTWVAEGAKRAGRDAKSIEIAPRLTLCASSDREVAYDTMRRDAAEFLVTLRPDDLDIETERFAAIEDALSRAKGWYFDPDAYHPPELTELVDDALVERFALCGDGDSLVSQFQRVVDLGFEALSLKLAPVRRDGQSMFEGLTETLTTVAEVVPQIKRLERRVFAS